MNQGTNLGSQIGRWIVLAAVVALLGALLLTIRPVGAQQDTAPTLSTAVTAHNYAENGKGSITTFRAKDPENNPVFWTLGGPDAADFTITERRPPFQLGEVPERAELRGANGPGER